MLLANNNITKSIRHTNGGFGPGGGGNTFRKAHCKIVSPSGEQYTICLIIMSLWWYQVCWSGPPLNQSSTEIQAGGGAWLAKKINGRRMKLKESSKSGWWMFKYYVCCNLLRSCHLILSDQRSFVSNISWTKPTNPPATPSHLWPRAVKKCVGRKKEETNGGLP